MKKNKLYTKIATASVVISAVAPVVASADELEEIVHNNETPNETGIEMTGTPEETNPEQEIGIPEVTDPEQEVETPEVTNPEQEVEAPEVTDSEKEIETSEVTDPEQEVETPEVTDPEQEIETPESINPEITNEHNPATPVVPEIHDNNETSSSGETTSTENISDESLTISDYAKPYISTLIEADSFSLPKEKVTKGEIADIIVKTLKHLEML